MDKHSKNSRTLDMYVRLCEGKIINKAEEAERFGVDERSIQRDIDDIRAFLNDYSVSHSSDSRTVEYNRAKKGFVMSGYESPSMTNSEILAVSKILLESRAFSKKEINTIIDKLVEGCVPIKNMKLVSDLLANEKYHYVELSHKSEDQDLIWKLGENIKEHNLMKIRYEKAGLDDEIITRIIEPVGIIFSEYYFYLNAYIDIKNDDAKYVHKYDYPTIFRIDRIVAHKTLKDKFRVPYSSRFEEGEFRKRVQFMYPGKLMNIRLRYYGINPEAILDRLPTAKIVEQSNTETIIDAEVYGKGIIMWILSQGNALEVLKPEELRMDIKRILSEMIKSYTKFNEKAFVDGIRAEGRLNEIFYSVQEGDYNIERGAQKAGMDVRLFEKSMIEAGYKIHKSV